MRWEKSKSRRSSQTAMYIILHGFTRLIAPILSFTADEIWKEMPHYDSDDLTSVVFNMMPVDEITLDVSSAFLEKWDRIHAIRDVVLAALGKNGQQRNR